jgi:glycosyltransferase involved in cell wall biosynthesis
VVVPTSAMADRLREFIPVETRRIAHIPWGVPDKLLAQPPQRPTEVPGSHLRVLYAGRLTVEKGASELIDLLGGVRDVRLSVAAPQHEYAALATAKDISATRYLGWLTRQQLWDSFADQDLLVIPSAELEAFGLVAVEAQACGLPVAYQPVPGLTETLGDSGLALDLLNDPCGAIASLTALRDDRGALERLRQAGRLNAARFPLSATAHALRELSESIA